MQGEMCISDISKFMEVPSQANLRVDEVFILLVILVMIARLNVMQQSCHVVDVRNPARRVRFVKGISRKV